MVSAILEAAQIVAAGSDMNKRMAAVVHRRGTILKTGVNTRLFSPLRRIPTPFSIHAELDALLDAYNSVWGADITVARVRRDGSWGNSKPCPACMSIIIRRGIKRVNYYEEGTWKWMGL